MIAALIQVLSQLRCFSTSCLADNDDNSIISDHGQKLITHAEDGQELALLLQSHAPRELTDSYLFLVQRVCIPVLCLIVDILCSGRRFFGFSVPSGIL